MEVKRPQLLLHRSSEVLTVLFCLGSEHVSQQPDTVTVMYEKSVTLTGRDDCVLFELEFDGEI